MMGFGYKGVAVKTNRDELLKLVELGLRKKKIVFPPANGPVSWNDRSIDNIGGTTK